MEGGAGGDVCDCGCPVRFMTGVKQIPTLVDYTTGQRGMTWRMLMYSGKNKYLIHCRFGKFSHSTKHVEVGDFYHRYTSNVRDGI